MRICSMAKSANEVLVQILGEKIQSARILQMEKTNGNNSSHNII